jgi:hypothetical protein
MCREALKGYLQTAVGQGSVPASEGAASRAPTGESPEAIERFVEEHNPEGLRNPEPVLEALRKVKVCDPACGSGAYLRCFTQYMERIPIPDAPPPSVQPSPPLSRNA